MEAFGKVKKIITWLLLLLRFQLPVFVLLLIWKIKN